MGVGGGCEIIENSNFERLAASASRVRRTDPPPSFNWRDRKEGKR